MLHRSYMQLIIITYFLKFGFWQIAPIGLVVLLQLLQEVPHLVVGEVEPDLVQHALHLAQRDAGLPWHRLLPGGVQGLLKFCLCWHFSEMKWQWQGQVGRHFFYFQQVKKARVNMGPPAPLPAVTVTPLPWLQLLLSTRKPPPSYQAIINTFEKVGSKSQWKQASRE